MRSLFVIIYYIVVYSSDCVVSFQIFTSKSLCSFIALTFYFHQLKIVIKCGYNLFTCLFTNFYFCVFVSRFFLNLRMLPLSGVARRELSNFSPKNTNLNLNWKIFHSPSHHATPLLPLDPRSKIFLKFQRFPIYLIK